MILFNIFKKTTNCGKAQNGYNCAGAATVFLLAPFLFHNWQTDPSSLDFTEIHYKTVTGLGTG